MKKKRRLKRMSEIERKIREEEDNLYKNPKINFKTNEKVILVFGPYLDKEIEAYIYRVNKKSYSVKDSFGETYRIDKLNLTGYPSYLYTEAQNIGSRKWIGSLVKIKKI